MTTPPRAPVAARALGGGRVLVAFGAPDARLQWFQRRPLFGRRIVVTRARDQASAAAALLREEGAEAISVPTIEIGPPADARPLDRGLSELRAGHYEWVAFTSANGVERTWDALVRGGGDARAFGWSRLAAIGPATARALEAHGLRADVVADEFRGEGLADAMLRAIGTIEGAVRVLLPRAAKARDVLPVTLEAAGCLVDVAPVYETRPPPSEVVEALAGELEAGRIDAVTLTSSSTVENLCDLLGDRAAALLGKTRLASIGPITTRTAEARGLRVSVTAAEYTLPGLVRALGVAARGWGPSGP